MMQEKGALSGRERQQAHNARVAAQAAETRARKTAVRRLLAAMRYGTINRDTAFAVLSKAEEMGVPLFSVPDAMLLAYLGYLHKEADVAAAAHSTRSRLLGA